MAINSTDASCEKSSKSQGSSNHSKHGHMPSSRLVKINFATEGSMSSLTFKQGKLKKNSDTKSPYLSGDSVSVVSRVTEKRYVNKKGISVVSSFPLAAKIYKANSDEFKTTKTNKKVQKSVLTLPNDPVPLPEPCTVSDINDCEYIKKNGSRKKIKKRPSTVTRKTRPRGKKFEFYDRDAQYCSLSDLDCSSADTIKNYYGDGKRTHKSIIAESKNTTVDKTNPHDVWEILRNINRFKFLPSPQMSEDSFIAPRKTKFQRRRNNRKDMRVYETCCTEEFAYISSYEVDKPSVCDFSRSSSFDKITVIDNEHDFNTFCKGFEQIVTKKKPVEKKLKQGSKGIKRKLPKSKFQSVKSNINKAITNNQSNKCDKTSSSSFICPNYKELKELLAKTTRDEQLDGSEIMENDEENTCIDIQHSRLISQCSGLICSENSGSSKAAVCLKLIANMKDENNLPNALNKQKYDAVKVNQPNQQINGITKVVLGKGQNVVQLNAAELSKTNPCKTFATSTNTVKHTKTEIMRLLNKQKFPIVILNKNQLSSTVEVVDEEHPQFNGLDKQIWPYMRNWYGIEHIAKKKNKQEEVEKHIIPKNSNECQFKLKDKQYKADHRVPVPLSEIFNQSQEQTKRKPTLQFRERIFKLLCKNAIGSTPNVTQKSTTIENEKYSKTLNYFTDVKDNLLTKEAMPTTDYSKKSKISTPVEKRPWAKAKWASDFIDNIIKKIKSGAYYNNDNKLHDRESAKEPEGIAIQTVPISTFDTASDECSISIPGFDATLPAVEVRTINLNEISVKHCVTNIMVHFNVTVPTKPPIEVKNSSSLIPVDVTKSQTRIFKCQTSILNAILPAELCSILPKMWKNIVELGEQVNLVPMLLDKTSSQFSTIREVAQYESHVGNIRPIKPFILPIMPIGQELWRLLNGRYRNSDIIYPKFNIYHKTLSVTFERRLVEELSPNITIAHLFGNEMTPVMCRIVTQKKNMSTPFLPYCNKQINTCTALQPYTEPNGTMISRFRPTNVRILFESTTSILNNIGESCFKIISSIDNIKITRFLNIPDIVGFSIDNFTTNSHINGCIENVSCTNVISLSVEMTNKIYKPRTNCIGKLNCLPSNVNASVQKYAPVTKKIKRNGFMRRYRKCKSESNTSEKKATPLSKLANLDDFFHVIGSGKLLSSVLDGQSGYKIMSAMQEMKNWTTEINQKQALLVLLLTNKKDTPNLLRYRPMLLHGIAVNRITKTNELDMEIEVIERENLNRRSRCEGITYLPASIENQDNLYEELCWIAKTTASDYQRPFDEASEKLLKSLLEKRKMLNPSYLRVMARYVGLGLLKSSCKK